MSGYFAPDEETSNEHIALVKTRKEHQCMGSDHHHRGEIAMIPIGVVAVRQTAINVDMGRVSCYVCMECADKWTRKVFGGE